MQAASVLGILSVQRLMNPSACSAAQAARKRSQASFASFGRPFSTKTSSVRVWATPKSSSGGLKSPLSFWL